MEIKTKRAYDNPEESDGCRILVDRLWPRGVSKEKLQINEWLKDIAPSDELRNWFNHDPEKFKGFQKRYLNELKNKTNEVEKLISICSDYDHITLVYSAKDRKHNNAVVLKKFLRDYIDQ